MPFVVATSLACEGITASGRMSWLIAKAASSGPVVKTSPIFEHNQIGLIEVFHNSLHIADLSRIAGQVTKAVSEHEDVTTRQSRRMTKVIR